MIPEDLRLSQVIDYESLENNIYGCSLCPKCGGKHRAPYDRREKKEGNPFLGPLSIECDDCGYKETGYSIDLILSSLRIYQMLYDRPV